MKAIWNGQIIAESNDTKVIEGNHYFPPNSIKVRNFLNLVIPTPLAPGRGSLPITLWKWMGKQNTDAAWYYPETSELAKQIKGYVAFWKGVAIEE